MNCDDCGTKVSTIGYLGGSILCDDCARKRRERREGEAHDSN